jgi:hypothetical protein
MANVNPFKQELASFIDKVYEIRHKQPKDGISHVLDSLRFEMLCLLVSVVCHRNAYGGKQ